MITHKLTLSGVLAGFVSLALLGASPASADDDLEFNPDFETSHVKDRKEIELDPTKAYILVDSLAAYPLTFFRDPTEEERAAVGRDRDRAYAEARAEYEEDIERYNRTAERYERRGARYQGKKPVEVTERNFSYPAPELSLMFTMGPFNRFAKDEYNLYLQEVPPGKYVFYGSFIEPLGTCVCMGTVSFTAEAGKITVMRYEAATLGPDGQPLADQDMARELDSLDLRARLGMFVGLPETMDLDPRLPSDWMVPADFEPVAFIPNWRGAEVNRIGPIPGVIDYDRDRVIDVQAEAAAKAAEEEAQRLAAEEAARAQAQAAAAEAEAAAAAAAADAAEGSADAASEDGAE